MPEPRLLALTLARNRLGHVLRGPTLSAVAKVF